MQYQHDDGDTIITARIRALHGDHAEATLLHIPYGSDNSIGVEIALSFIQSAQCMNICSISLPFSVFSVASTLSRDVIVLLTHSHSQTATQSWIDHRFSNGMEIVHGNRFDDRDLIVVVRKSSYYTWFIWLV